MRGGPGREAVEGQLAGAWSAGLRSLGFILYALGVPEGFGVRKGMSRFKFGETFWLQPEE